MADICPKCGELITTGDGSCNCKSDTTSQSTM